MLTTTKWFQEVDNEELNIIFEEKWKRICEENKFIYVSKEYHLLEQEGIKRFLITDTSGRPIGTVELVRFNPGGYSIINHYYDFASVGKYQKFKGSVYEVGKLSIDIEERNEGHLEKILLLILSFSKSNNVKYILAAMEGKLFRQLDKFGLNLVPLADEITEETYSAVPLEFDAQKLFSEIENNRWLHRKFKRMGL